MRVNVDLIRSRLGKHGREKKKIILINQEDTAAIPIRQQSGKFAGCSQSGEARTDNNEGLSPPPP